MATSPLTDCLSPLPDACCPLAFSADTTHADSNEQIKDNNVLMLAWSLPYSYVSQKTSQASWFNLCAWHCAPVCFP